MGVFTPHSCSLFFNSSPDTGYPMTINFVIEAIWALSALGLIVLVLLHSPKGDGLGGLGGQAQLFTSTKSAETALNRATWVLTVLFMGLTVILSANWLPK
jgi:preprotein translocase subunit SecG